MIIVYMVILCLSTALAAWAAVRVVRRLMPMLGLPIGAGWCVLLPAVAFLIVVGTPPPVLVGTLLIAGLLALFGHRYDAVSVALMVLMAAVFIGLTGLHAPSLHFLTTIPPLLALACMGILWVVMGFGPYFMRGEATVFSLGAMAALAAIAAAPLQLPSAQPLMFDALIVASAFGGLLLARGGAAEMGTAPRLSLGFLIAYLQLAAIWQGAWLAGVASMVIWMGTIGWVWLRQDPWGVAHV